MLKNCLARKKEKKLTFRLRYSFAFLIIMNRVVIRMPFACAYESAIDTINRIHTCIAHSSLSVLLNNRRKLQLEIIIKINLFLLRSQRYRIPAQSCVVIEFVFFFFAFYTTRNRFVNLFIMNVSILISFSTNEFIWETYARADASNYTLYHTPSLVIQTEWRNQHKCEWRETQTKRDEEKKE